MFDSYHYCAPRTQLKIVHRNGCGPVPQLCGYTPDPDSEYWRGKKNFYVDLHVNIEVKQSLSIFYSPLFAFLFHSAVTSFNKRNTCRVCGALSAI